MPDASARNAGFADAPHIDMATMLDQLTARRGRPPFFEYFGFARGRGAGGGGRINRWI